MTAPDAGDRTDGSPSMRRALGDLWAALARIVSRAAGWLGDPTLILRVRGYVVVALGVAVVTRVLEAVVGSLPGLPTDFAAGLLVLTIVLAMLTYRQSLAFLRRHESEARDQIERRPLSAAAASVGPSERTRIARERHWRSQRATLWASVAFVALMAYAFGVMSTVRVANVIDAEGNPSERRVVVPLVLPEATRNLIFAGVDPSLNPEPLDDVLTQNGAYFAEAFPNEFPEYVMASVLPLQVLLVAFCMMVTRSFAFAVAPPPEPVSRAGGVATKEQPDGDDGFDAAVEVADDIVGMI